MERDEIVIFENEEVRLEVDLERDTVWLTQAQMVELFATTKQNVSLHINNVFKDKELDKEAVVKESLTTASDGKKYKTKQYSLDVIISVGYRVKSNRGVQFRIWATSILKDYLMKGHAINKKRLEVLNKTIEIQSRMIAHSLSIDVDEIDFVIKSYTNALCLLDDYDHQCIGRPMNLSVNLYHLKYDECKEVITKMAHYKSTEVFGIEKEKGKLEGIIAAVYQECFGIKMYPSVEEKAANLLYFLVKDHPFADGCKRIAATLFLHFLNKNNYLFKEGRQTINNSALVAITIMIAESNPSEKEIMIHLVMNILQETNSDEIVKI